MINLIIFLLFCGCLWIWTGVSPLIWISRSALFIESIRQQAWLSAGVAYRDFRANHAGTYSVLKNMEGGR